MLKHGNAEYDLVTLDDCFRTEVKPAQRIAAHAVCAGVVNDEVRLELREGLWQGAFKLKKIGVIVRAFTGVDVVGYALLGEVVTRVDVMVIDVEDTVFGSIHVVSCMPVSLMCIKVDDHESFVPVPEF